jgi:hypothetical protein
MEDAERRDRRQDSGTQVGDSHFDVNIRRED